MEDLELAIVAARRGATIVRERFGGAAATALKGRLDPVTDVDEASERAVVDALRDAHPEDGILGEEGSAAPSTTGRLWIVDPLDGTVNFIHGIPQVGVSVSLYVDDEPQVAVTIDPLRDEEYTAVAGAGARLNGEPMTVSSVTAIERSVVATGFPYDHDLHAAEYAATLGAVLERVNGIRRMGSAVLDLAWVAAGRYEAYWETKLAPWDMAAGILLVAEAGGVVTDERGAAATPRTTTIVAGSPAIQEAVRSIVLEAGRCGN